MTEFNSLQKAFLPCNSPGRIPKQKSYNSKKDTGISRIFFTSIEFLLSTFELRIVKSCVEAAFCE